MICSSTVLAVCTRSTCAPRFLLQAQGVVETINNTAAAIFFMTQPPIKNVGFAVLCRLHSSYGRSMEFGRRSELRNGYSLGSSLVTRGDGETARRTSGGIVPSSDGADSKN